MTVENLYFGALFSEEVWICFVCSLQPIDSHILGQSASSFLTPSIIINLQYKLLR